MKPWLQLLELSSGEKQGPEKSSRSIIEKAVVQQTDATAKAQWVRIFFMGAIDTTKDAEVRGCDPKPKRRQKMFQAGELPTVRQILGGSFKAVSK